MSFVLVAAQGDRELWIDFASRATAEGEEGALLYAATRDGDEWVEQTIYEPNYLARRQETIVRRLRELSELTPQRVVS